MPYKDPKDERGKISKQKYYLRNRQKYYDKNKTKAQQMREYVDKIKDVPCKDCGERHPSFGMDFDHRERESKYREIAKLVHGGSWENLYMEIAKCDVVCSNCHRIRTYGKK